MNNTMDNLKIFAGANTLKIEKVGGKLRIAGTFKDKQRAENFATAGKGFGRTVVLHGDNSMVEILVD